MSTPERKVNLPKDDQEVEYIPTCMWCDRQDVTYDPSNEMYVCPDHIRKGPAQ